MTHILELIHAFRRSKLLDSYYMLEYWRVKQRGEVRVSGVKLVLL